MNPAKDGIPAIRKRAHHAKTPDESLIFGGIEHIINAGWRGDEIKAGTYISLQKLIAVGNAAEEMLEMRMREQGL